MYVYYTKYIHVYQYLLNFCHVYLVYMGINYAWISESITHVPYTEYWFDYISSSSNLYTFADFNQFLFLYLFKF